MHVALIAAPQYWPSTLLLIGRIAIETVYATAPIPYYRREATIRALRTRGVRAACDPYSEPHVVARMTACVCEC